MGLAMKKIKWYNNSPPYVTARCQSQQIPPLNFLGCTTHTEGVGILCRSAIIFYRGSIDFTWNSPTVSLHSLKTNVLLGFVIQGATEYTLLSPTLFCCCVFALHASPFQKARGWLTFFVAKTWQKFQACTYKVHLTCALI